MDEVGSRAASFTTGRGAAEGKTRWKSRLEVPEGARGCVGRSGSGGGWSRGSSARRGWRERRMPERRGLGLACPFGGVVPMARVRLCYEQRPVMNVATLDVEALRAGSLGGASSGLGGAVRRGAGSGGLR